MAESSNAQPTPNLQRIRSQVQFSDDQGSSDPEAHPRSSRAGAGSPQSRKLAKASRGSAGADARRRTRSLAARSLLPTDFSPLEMFPGMGKSGLTRSAEEVKGFYGLGLDSTMDVFSDEYDLCEAHISFYLAFLTAERILQRTKAILKFLLSDFFLTLFVQQILEFSKTCNTPWN